MADIKAFNPYGILVLNRLQRMMILPRFFCEGILAVEDESKMMSCVHGLQESQLYIL